MKNDLDQFIDSAAVKIVEISNIVSDKLCEIQERNAERIAKAIAFVLVKTVLKDYMVNMSAYELKHWEEDMPVNERN